MLPIVGIIIVIGLGSHRVFDGWWPYALVDPPFRDCHDRRGGTWGHDLQFTPKVLKDVMKGLITLLKGGNVGKQTYNQAFKLLYELFRVARRDGMLAWETILSRRPQSMRVFQKYPKIANDHHLMEFVTGRASGGDGRQ